MWEPTDMASRKALAMAPQSQVQCPVYRWSAHSSTKSGIHVVSMHVGVLPTPVRARHPAGMPRGWHAHEREDDQVSAAALREPA